MASSSEETLIEHVRKITQNLSTYYLLDPHHWTERFILWRTYEHTYVARRGSLTIMTSLAKRLQLNPAAQKLLQMTHYGSHQLELEAQRTWFPWSIFILWQY